MMGVDYTRNMLWPRWRKVAATIIWTVPEAAVRVLCTPDNGCGLHPKHIVATLEEISGNNNMEFTGGCGHNFVYS